jgi:integrase
MWAIESIRTADTGCCDATMAKQVLGNLVKRVENVRAGIHTKAEDAVIDHQKVPIAKHFDAYAKSQAAKGRHAGRIKTTTARLNRIASDCKFARLVDLDAVAFEAWLDDRAGEGMSAGNRNEFRQAMLGFCNWCMKPTVRRLTSNPFATVAVADARLDQRRKRRAMTEAELSRLLEIARARPLQDALTVRRGKHKGQQAAKLSNTPRDRLERIGWERTLIYKTLLLTGLRKGELTSITLGQVDLDAALLKLNPGDEKNREGNVIPLRGDLVADLRLWVDDMRQRGLTAASTSLFTVPAGLLRILDRDLVAAGLARVFKDTTSGKSKIDKRDERGRTIDIHALRHTFVTNLSKGGVAPLVAQAAARHSDIGLTMNVYTDPKQLDVVAALATLPSLEVKPHTSAASDESALVTVLATTIVPACVTVANSVKEAVDAASQHVAPTDDVSVIPVNKKDSLTTVVNESEESGRQDLNPTPILRQTIATLAVASIAKCAALQMRCVQGALIGFLWR